MKKVGVGLDVVALGLFVGIGRDVHAHGLSVGGMASTGWPFSCGLVGGWLWVARRHRALEAPGSGAVVVLWTVTLGMILRVVAGQGTALAFVLVALGFLGATMVGWRMLVAGVHRVAARPAASRR